jgi:hypothetical protein
MTDGVHAGVHDMQPTPISTVGNSVPPDPEVDQLPARDHSVLTLGEPPNPLVNGRVCDRAAYDRIDVTRVRHAGDGRGVTRTPRCASVTTVPVEPIFFATPAEFRAWLEENHLRESELWVGFHKKRSGRPSITWAESVDQALCFGWIDGVRKGLDEDSYVNRFTPRQKRSKWSNVNLKRFEELRAAGLVRPAGLEAFERRVESATSRPSSAPSTRNG